MRSVIRLLLFCVLLLAGTPMLRAHIPKTRAGEIFSLAAPPRPEIALQVPELRLDNPALYGESASGRLFWTKFDPEGLAEKDPAKAYKAIRGLALRGERAFAGKKVTSEMLEREFGAGPKIQALKEFEKKHGKVAISYSNEGQIDMSAYKVAEANVGAFSKEVGGSGADIAGAWRQLKSGNQFSKEQIASLEKTHTWHHTGSDGKLELVPREINDAFPHTGGAAFARSGAFGKQAAGLAIGAAALVSSTAEAATGGDPSATNIASGVVQDVVKPIGTIKMIMDGLHSAGRTMMQSLENQVYGPPGEDDDYAKYRTK